MSVSKSQYRNNRSSECSRMGRGYTLTSLILLVLPGWMTERTYAFVTPSNNHNTYNNNLLIQSVDGVRCMTMLHESSPSAAEKNYEELEEEAFKARTKKLCMERNLPLEKVKNCRDLSSVKNSPILPNKIIRMGRVSDATEQDIEKYVNNIKTLVDLRSPTELKEDESLSRFEVYSNYVDLVYDERRSGGGLVRELAHGEPRIRGAAASTLGNNQNDFLVLKAVDVAEECNECDVDQLQDMAQTKESNMQNGRSQKQGRYVRVFPPGTVVEGVDINRKERHFVSIMNEFKYVLGTLSKLRKRDILRAVIKSPGAIVSKRVRTGVKDVFLDEINQGGLIMLNELLLRFGAPGIKYVLQLCADETRHPIGFYCTAGKDRTGMIAAIILALVGVADEDIVEDYSLSANVYAEMNDHKAMVGALSQRNLNPKTFLGAPPHVMRDTLVSIRQNYGSIEGYLDFIGFDEEQREKLKKALL